ncbi:MAG: phenylalanine--tRNA ligase subunit beta [Ignavibacteriae bacterium]|nr:phenylalanine--tRNA ligase subunit beta [Ignavibacteriota bacterium]
MIVSLNWLKEYIDLEGIATEEIVEKLTTSGSEVDEVFDKAKDLEGIVVGFVEEVKKHPNADRLSVCKVTDGEQTYNVVCGAPNVAPNQKVVFGKLGAVIPKGKFELKKTKIRGELSEGMLCAEDELELGDDHDGILILDESAEIGQTFANSRGLNDIVLDIAITPNRADSLSHIGITRDLSAIFNRKVKYPTLITEYNVKNNNSLLEILNEDYENCPRYSAVIIKDIEVKESPQWLKEKLISIGLRPINNIVDATNFVLHEVGQPLHAFDLDTLSNGKIVIKQMGDSSKFVTLDSKERNMLPNSLMICDGEKPVAIAGVMGGENSEVSNSTNNIVIESAFFNPSSVRKTSKKLGLSTDASYRFERGTDINGTMNAAIRAAEIIKDIAGGTIDDEVIDIYPKPFNSNEVSVRFFRIAKVLGFEIEHGTVVDILKNLEFEIVEHDLIHVKVRVPSFRQDIEREIDLIEEVIRIYGFENIPPVEKISIPLAKKIDETKFEDTIRNKMVSLGYSEVVSNSLVSDEKSIDYEHSIKVLNPQSSEMTRLRTSLISPMLLNISRNIKVKEDNLKLFELGQTFKTKEQEVTTYDAIDQNQNLIIALSGKKNLKNWFSEEGFFSFYDLSSDADAILNNKYLDSKIKDTYNEQPNEIFDFSFEKKIKNNSIGVGGKLSKEFLRKFEVEKDVFVFEINLDIIKNLKVSKTEFSSVLKYPKVVRDFAFILDKDISYKTVVGTIKNNSSNLLKNVKLFDIFESDTLGKHKKSLAFQLEYFDETKTLTEDEIDKEFWNTIEKVKTKLKAELRG